MQQKMAKKSIDTGESQKKTRIRGQRKTQILEEARNLIFNEGFGNFTVRNVALRVDISEAAIYRHFSSKEDLMLALLDSLFSPWRTAISQLLQKKAETAFKLVSLAEIHLHHLLEKQLNPMLFFSEAIQPGNENLLNKLRTNLEFLQAAVFQMISDGKKNGEIKESCEIECAVATVTGILQTSVIRWTVSMSAAGLTEVTHKNMKFFAGLISCKRDNHGKR